MTHHPSWQSQVVRNRVVVAQGKFLSVDVLRFYVDELDKGDTD